MKKFLLSILLCTSLLANDVDRSVTSFERREKQRIDHFDFSGEWPNIEVIDIDATRKKRVEIDLTGHYPLLEKIHFEGGFGLLNGAITGQFPKLTTINFLCGSSAMTLDFRAKWTQSCEINVRGMKENINITLPAEVGLVVMTKVGARGHVYVEGLKKKGFGLLNKHYKNALADRAEIVLYVNIEATDGNIFVHVPKA